MKLDRFKGNHYQQFQPEQQLNISTTNPINIYGDGGGVQTPEPDLHSKNPNESVRQARMNVTDTINKIRARKTIGHYTYTLDSRPAFNRRNPRCPLSTIFFHFPRRALFLRRTPSVPSETDEFYHRPADTNS